MHEDIYIFSQYQRENGEADVPMAGISFCDQSYFIERENYGHYVIEYTVEGEGVLEAGGQKWRICPKTTYFLYPGAGHRYYCPGGTWHKIWVVMTGKLAEALFSAYLPGKPQVMENFDIQSLMEGVISLAKDESLSYEEMVSRMTLCVHRILIAASEHAKPETDSLAAAVKKFLDDHLQTPLQLSSLSRRFNYSRNHIINQFRMHYGMTPYAYYESRKMIMARELLQNTSSSVRDVSERLGYENPQYFSKRFQKYYGVSPSRVKGKG